MSPAFPAKEVSRCRDNFSNCGVRCDPGQRGGCVSAPPSPTPIPDRCHIAPSMGTVCFVLTFPGLVQRGPEQPAVREVLIAPGHSPSAALCPRESEKRVKEIYGIYGSVEEYTDKLTASMCFVKQ